MRLHVCVNNAITKAFDRVVQLLAIVAVLLQQATELVKKHLEPPVSCWTCLLSKLHFLRIFTNLYIMFLENRPIIMFFKI